MTNGMKKQMGSTDYFWYLVDCEGYSYDAAARARQESTITTTIAIMITKETKTTIADMTATDILLEDKRNGPAGPFFL